MATTIITVNGNSVTIKSSGSVVMTNGRILVDGIDVTPGGEAKQINVSVTGDIANLQIDNCHTVTVGGAVNTLRTGSGNVRVEKTVQNLTSSSGDVQCGDVGGNVQTSSGDVTCGKVTGSVRTSSGDIRNKR